MVVAFRCWLLVLGSLFVQTHDVFRFFKCVFNEAVLLQIVKMLTVSQMLLFQFWVTSQFSWWMTQFYGQENRNNFVRPLVYYLQCVSSLQLFTSNHVSKIISTWVGNFALRPSVVKYWGEWCVPSYLKVATFSLLASCPIPIKHVTFLFNNFDLFKHLKCWKCQRMVLAFFFLN